MEHVSHTAHIVTATALLLLIAAGTLGLTKRFKLPFTIILVLVGMAISALVARYPETLGVLGKLEISPDLILFVFLPTLIFESTFNMDVQRLRQNLGPVLALAAPGLLISTALIGGIVSLATGLPLIASLLLGAILSATDPVAVIALFKQLGAPKRLVVLVEGESLFNDATSIVVAKILLGVLAAGMVSGDALTAGALDFVLLFLGGVAAGIVMGWIAGWLLGLVLADALIEISITTAVAYLSFLVAEEVLHVSGVMATVGAGLTLGGWGRVKISPPVREYLEHFWEYMAFLANALIFLLVGMKISLPALAANFDTLVVVILAMTIARAAVVYGLVPLLSRLPGAEPIDLRYQTVIFWGGLRGAIALAIVLSLEKFEYADLFTAVVMGAVLFTLLIQGFTMAPLMRRLGLDTPPVSDRLARLQYRLSAQKQALEQIPELQRGGQFSGPITQHIRREVLDEMDSTRTELTQLREQEVGAEREQALLHLHALAEERSCHADLFAKGHLSERAYRQLLLTLDTQAEALRTRDRFVRIQTHRLRRRLEPHLYAILERLPGLSRLAEHLRLDRLALNYENDWAHYQSAQQVLERLEELATLHSVSPEGLRAVRSQYQEWLAKARQRLDETAEQFPEFVNAMQERLGRRLVLITAATTARRHAERGSLPREVEEAIQDDLRHEIHALSGPASGRLRVEPEEILRKVPCFADLPDAEFARLAKVPRAHTFAANEDVIRQGETGRSLYLVARGVLRVLLSRDGERIELATLMAGDYFGEMALLDDEPRSATVRTVTPCAVYELDRKSLDALMREHPAIRAALVAADEEHRANQRKMGDRRVAARSDAPDGPP